MLAKKIATNFIISAVGRVISFALALVIVGFTSRYLGRDGFGQYATILAFVYVFSVFADLGLYQIAMREISKEGSDEKQIISAAFSLRFFWGILVFAASPVVAMLFPYGSTIKTGILIAAIGFWLLSDTQVLIGIFQKHLKTEFVALGDVAGRAVQLILIMVFIHLNLGFYSIVLTIAVGAFLNFLVVYFAAKKFINFKLRIDFFAWKKILIQSMPLAIAGVLTMIYFKMDTVLLSLMKPAADVGIYGLAYRVLESLIFFPAMFVGLVMPQMMKYLSQNNVPAFSRVCQKTLDILLMGAVPLMVGGWFLSKKIVFLLGGADFVAASQPLNILLAATAIIFFGSFFSNILIVSHRQKSLGYIYGSGALLNVAANLFFIPRFSYIGAAGTTLATEIFVTILMVLVVFRKDKYLFSFKILYKVVPACLMMAIYLWWISLTAGSMVLELVGGAVIYLVFLILFKAFHKEDLALLLNQDGSRL